MSLQRREVGKTAVSTQMKMVQPKNAIKDANTTNDAINDIDMHYHNNIVDLSNTSSSSNNASIPISISQLKIKNIPPIGCIILIEKYQQEYKESGYKED